MKSKDALNVFNAISSYQLKQAQVDLEKSQNFTYEGLKELHAKTFNDNGTHHIEVSKYFLKYNKVRESNISGNYPYKDGRPIAGLEDSMSLYSNMKSVDIDRTKKAINECHPDNMTNLSFEDKIKKLTDMYREMDWTHSFADGNSRVGRAFVSEVAKASKVEMNWEKVSQLDIYIARDRSLAEMAIKHEGKNLDKNDPQTKKYLLISKENLDKKYPDTNLKKIFDQCCSKIKISLKDLNLNQNTSKEPSTTKSKSNELSK